MLAFGERARRELQATGETVRKRQEENRNDLTPQEQQIADLAREGSPINVKFVELYRQAKQSNAALLNNPGWPLTLADQAAGLIASVHR